MVKLILAVAVAVPVGRRRRGGATGIVAWWTCGKAGPTAPTSSSPCLWSSPRRRARLRPRGEGPRQDGSRGEVPAPRPRAGRSPGRTGRTESSCGWRSPDEQVVITKIGRHPARPGPGQERRRDGQHSPGPGAGRRAGADGRISPMADLAGALAPRPLHGARRRAEPATATGQDLRLVGNRKQRRGWPDLPGADLVRPDRATLRGSCPPPQLRLDPLAAEYDAAIQIPEGGDEPSVRVDLGVESRPWAPVRPGPAALPRRRRSSSTACDGSSSGC